MILGKVNYSKILFMNISNGVVAFVSSTTEWLQYSKILKDPHSSTCFIAKPLNKGRYYLGYWVVLSLKGL